MFLFDSDSSSPHLGNLSDPMVSHDPNPSMEHNSSHSSHDEDEALRVPLEQVDKLATEIDKMHDWLLQENHNTKTNIYFYALKKVIHNDEHNVTLLYGLTYLVHTHFKPLTQVSSKVGITLYMFLLLSLFCMFLYLSLEFIIMLLLL